MKLHALVEHCRSLPHVVEDIKWGNDLVFSITGGRMFCVFGLDGEDHSGVCFKVDDHRFLEMTDRPQFIPAPYMARARWVKLTDTRGVPRAELRQLVSRSHELYFHQLSKTAQKKLLGQ